MAGILVYALHDDEGNFNKNSLGAISVSYTHLTLPTILLV